MRRAVGDSSMTSFDGEKSSLFSRRRPRKRYDTCPSITTLTVTPPAISKKRRDGCIVVPWFLLVFLFGTKTASTTHALTSGLDHRNPLRGERLPQFSVGLTGTTTSLLTQQKNSPIRAGTSTRRCSHVQSTLSSRRATKLFALSDPRQEHSFRPPSTTENGTDLLVPSPRRNDIERNLGVILAVSIILVLGLSTTQEATVTLLEQQGLSTDLPLGGANAVPPLNEVAMATVTNVIESYVPTTSTDLVAVALGESVGGVVGATFSVAINMLIQASRNHAMVKFRSASSLDNDDDDSQGDVANRRRQTFLSQALSDSDFFIANGAFLSLFEALGMNVRVAKLGSVVLASIPSQLVKLGPNIKERRSQEEQILQQLLLRQQEEQRKEQEFAMKSNFFAWANKVLMPRSVSTAGTPTSHKNANPAELVPVLKEATAIDFVEIFSDVTRWLEYDALNSEYMGTLDWNGETLDLATTGALLGLFAGVSSRLYADILYGWFHYGPTIKQQEVRERTNPEWLSLYFSCAASSAALFGFYELSQRPISRWIQGTLAGGADGCIGSSSFDLCLQTYIDQNAPGPSSDAQFRALITNLYMVAQRINDVAMDTTTIDDVSALVRAWSVTWISYWNHLFLAFGNQ